MNDNDVSSYYKEALATDSFTVHNNFLNMLLKDGSALGIVHNQFNTILKYK